MGEDKTYTHTHKTIALNFPPLKQNLTKSAI